MQLVEIMLIGLIIIIISTVLGAHKGFIKMLIPLFGIGISLAITRYSIDPISNFLVSHTKIYSEVKENLKNLIPVFENVITASDENNIIYNSYLPQFLKDALVENNNTVIYKLLGVTSFYDYVPAYIAKVAINVISLIGSFLVSFIIYRIICSVLQIAQLLPVVHGINGFLGGVVGLFVGIVVAYIIVLALSMYFMKTSIIHMSGDVFNNVFFHLLNNKYNIVLKWVL